MPFIEQDNLWNQALAWAKTDPSVTNPIYNTKATPTYWYWPWGDFWNSFATTGNANPALGTAVKTYICPSEIRNLLVEYQMIAGPTGLSTPIAFTAYLGVDGISGDGIEDLTKTPSYPVLAEDPSATAPFPDWSGILVSSTRNHKKKVTFASVSDGTSNTLMVGERPPSQDLSYGWWFAGAGFDGIGVGDVILGAREIRYAENVASIVVGNYASACPVNKVGFQPGTIQDNCDQPHFWSWHPGGANWTFGDGSARFITYTIDSPPQMTPTTVLMQLVTRSGGEVITGDY